MIKVGEVLETMIRQWCPRCLNNTHLCPSCHTTTNHDTSICKPCDTQLEMEAA